MHIRPLEVSADEEFADFYAIERDAELFDRPDAPFASAHEERVFLLQADPFERITAYAAFDGDRMVGAALTAFTLLDNTDKGFVQVDVAPPLRRRGIGSALVEHLVELCRQAERDTVLAQCWVPLEQRDSHPDALFASKNGFELANVEIRRQLELPVPMEQLDAWSVEAATHHRNYGLLTFVDQIPDALLPSLCEVSNQLAVDAPTGTLEFEVEGLTPEVHKIRQAILEEQDRSVFTTLALDPSGGRTVAFSTLMVPRRQQRVVHQWGTLVDRAHRGHRLGLAVKAANLRAVQTSYPDRRVAETTNAETNAPMVAINEKMGFAPVELLTEFQRKLIPA
ncbi:MAG: GNAT family N-acetyltransferase [Nocardioidaceae bacterium]